MEFLNILKNYVKTLFGNHEGIVEKAANAVDTAEKVVEVAGKVKKIAKKSGFPTGKLAKAKAKPIKVKTTKKKK